MKTAGKTWKELEKAAMDRGEMEISGLSLMCHLGVMRIIYLSIYLSAVVRPSVLTV